MRDPSRRVAALAAVAAVVVAVLAVVTNVATAEVPHALRFLTPPSRAWMLTGFLIVVSAVLAFMAARSGDRPRQVSTPEQVGAAADLLAQRMTAFWADQVVKRGIQTPAPVRVRWSWAGDDIALPREELNASSNLGTDPRPLLETGSDASGVEQVLGSGLVTRLHHEVYARLRHGRLMLIGGPGAGKTGAMILLLLDALRHRDLVPAADQAGVPVPVWLTLGSWDPRTRGLRDWVTATMARDHPYLCAVDFGPDAIGQLLDTGRVALFLDGLDEMPDALRGSAMERLTKEAAGLRVVLTSRPDEYRATLEAGRHLPYTAVVELRPVSPRAAADYLLEGQVGSARNRWQQVTDHLQAHREGVLARTLNTPLTLSLARSARASTDPTWLLSPDLGSEQALRGRLLDQVLVTAYPDLRERAHATYWLSWIAYHMDTSRDLSWWRIPGWIPPWRIRQALGFGFGIGFGLVVGLVVGLGFGLGFGLVVGLVVGIGSGLVGESVGASGLGLGLGLGGWRCGCEQTPQVLILRRPAIREVRLLLVVGLMVGLVAWLMVWLVFWLVGWLLGGLGFGLVGLVAWLMVWLLLGPLGGLGTGFVSRLLDVWSVSLTTSPDTTPRSIHRQDVRTRFVVGLVGGLVGGLGFGLGFGLVGVFVGVFAGGLAVGLVGFVHGSSPRLLVAELVLAAGGRRVRFMPLLETALERQVLRQAGAVYQFRHAELQDRLADRYRREHLGAAAIAGGATVVDLTPVPGPVTPVPGPVTPAAATGRARPAGPGNSNGPSAGSSPGTP